MDFLFFPDFPIFLEFTKILFTVSLRASTPSVFFFISETLQCMEKLVHNRGNLENGDYPGLFRFCFGVYTRLEAA